MSSTAKVLKLMSEDSADWLSSLEARGVVLHQVREVEIGIEEKVFVEEHELRVLKSLCPNLKTLTVKRLSWDKRRAPLALAGLEQLSVEASEYRKEWFDMKSLRSIKLQGLRDKSDELVITAEDNLELPELKRAEVHGVSGIHHVSMPKLTSLTVSRGTVDCQVLAVNAPLLQELECMEELTNMEALTSLKQLQSLTVGYVDDNSQALSTIVNEHPALQRLEIGEKLYFWF